MRGRLRSWLVSLLADALREAETKYSRDRFTGRMREMTEATERLGRDIHALRVAGSVDNHVKIARRGTRKAV